MATQKKRKSLRAPFVMTASATLMALAAASGCGTSVSTTCPGAAPAIADSCIEDGQTCNYGEDFCGSPIEYRCDNGAWEQVGPTLSCNPPPVVCPATVPASASGCEQIGLSCQYPGNGDCVFGYTATCQDDFSWQVIEDIGSCNPPACPFEIPNQGEPCTPTWEPYCYYTVDTGCGPMDAQATCVDGFWQVATPTCNPPPPEYCYMLTLEPDCDQMAPFCRWLVPGCADPGMPPSPLPNAGCFPNFDCVTSDECPVGTSCSQVVIDPCYNKDCDACGANVNVCVGP